KTFWTNGRSNGRQHRKHLSASTNREIGVRPFALIERAYTRRGRPAAACLDCSVNLGSRPGEHGLDRTITPVAYPAPQTMLMRFVLDKGAIADTLDAATHDDMADDSFTHAPSPHR